MLDLPPDVPPQYAPIVVAEAKQETKERTIGVCKLIESRPESRLSAVNSVDVLGIVWGYLGGKERIALQEADFHAAKAALLQAPKHGTLDWDEPSQTAGYTPDVLNFDGSDQATFLVKMAEHKVTVKYFIKVMPNVPGSGEEYDPYGDKRFCPNGHVWKIALTLDELRITVTNSSSHLSPTVYHVSHNKPLEPTR